LTHEASSLVLLNTNLPDGSGMDLLLAVKRVLAGSKYVSAALAEQMANELGHSRPESHHDAASPWEGAGPRPSL